MVEYIGDGITYGQVALKAILPAVLYFTGIFIAVHLEAKKLGLRGIAESDLPKMKDLVKKIYLLTPIILLIVLVATGARTIQFAAAVSIGAVIIVNLFDKDNRINLSKVINDLWACGGPQRLPLQGYTVAAAHSSSGRRPHDDGPPAHN